MCKGGGRYIYAYAFNPRLSEAKEAAADMLLYGSLRMLVGGCSLPRR
jgi:hypothetical protein